MTLLINVIQEFFSSWRFPVLALSILSFFLLAILGVLFVPLSSPSLAAFAEDFKIWCFGYDPASGEMEWGYSVVFVFQPLLMGGFILWIWGNQLREIVFKHPRKILPYIAGAFMIVSSIIVTLNLMVDNEARAREQQTELPFPAERLRTSFLAPNFSLKNQNQETVSLENLKGNLILVTAVYARCGYTCPMIFAQIKRAIAQLSTSEKSALKIVGITLDPENDTPQILKQLADAQEIKTPFFHLLTGTSVEVNTTLDKFGFSRKKDLETGIIDHANLFIIIDRKQRVAYRFTLGERQEKWLIKALKLLSDEFSIS